MKPDFDFYKIETQTYIETWNYAVSGYVNWFRWDKKERSFDFQLFTVEEYDKISLHKAQLNEKAMPIGEDEYRLLYKEFRVHCFEEYLRFRKYENLDSQWKDYWDHFKEYVNQWTKFLSHSRACHALAEFHVAQQLKPLSQLLPDHLKN